LAHALRPYLLQTVVDEVEHRPKSAQYPAAPDASLHEVEEEASWHDEVQQGPPEQMAPAASLQLLVQHAEESSHSSFMW